jgi:hypothetical protein
MDAAPAAALHIQDVLAEAADRTGKDDGSISGWLAGHSGSEAGEQAENKAVWFSSARALRSSVESYVLYAAMAADPFAIAISMAPTSR